MGEEARKLESWESVIVDFFETQVAQSKLYKARTYIEKKKSDIESEKNPKKKARLIKSKEEKQSELEKLRTEAPFTEIRDWLNKITDRDNTKAPIKDTHKISKATHVLKFSHSSSDPASILVEEKCSNLMLTTSSFKKKLTFDLAHSDGALITISRFLGLSLHKKQIIDHILEDTFDFLESFTSNNEELENWKYVFKNVVEVCEINTADKSKQLYFPVPIEYSTSDEPYHLILPIFASSLAHEINIVVSEFIYGDKQKEINNARKGAIPKYHALDYLDFIGLGIQKFGGEYPRNVSMLNANRSGKSYLFSTQPPTWQSQLKPPIYKGSLFDNFSTSHINEEINYLRDFLLRFERIDLSFKNPKRYAHLVRWVNSIIDEVLFYTASIQELPSNWSATDDIKLKPEHQYFLDPYRDENDFQSKRQSIDWQTVVCNDFAKWLNRRLTAQDKKFTPQPEHTRLWKQLFEEPLREGTEAFKAEIKYKQQEEKV